MMNSKTNRTDGSKASVVRFAMLLPPSRCLSLEEASLGEGRLTHERTEQETMRVRRLFSNHYGVLFHTPILTAFICTFTNLRRNFYLSCVSR